MARGNSSYRPVDSYVLNLTVSSPPKPDLAFETFSLSPPYPGPGDTVTFTARVMNLGTVDAGAFSVGFWSDWPEGSSPGVADIPEQETALSGLAAGETVTLTFTMTAPEWGSFRSFVYVDCGSGASEVPESDEDNNLG
jgi:subtilase family serine protease